MGFRDLSIKAKLQSMILLTVFIVLMLNLSIYLFYQYNASHKTAVQELTSVARLIAENAAVSMIFNDREGARQLLQSLETRDDVFEASLYDRNGRIFASYRRAENDAESLFPEILGESNIELSMTVEADRDKLGHLALTGSLQNFWVLLKNQTMISLVVFALSLFIAYLLSTLFQRLISTPVNNLLYATQRIAQNKRFDHQVPVESRDEFGQLVESFNLMLQQLQDYEQRLVDYQKSLEKQVQRRTSELEKAKIAAEAASIAKSNFLAMMSHEIRTPMNGVVGFVSLLEQSDLTNDQREYVKSIAASADILLSVINEILDFSKMESGMFALDNRDFSLEELIGELDIFNRRRFEEKGLELHFNIEPGLPAFMHGDETRIKQILNNLLSNAFKFTEQGEVLVNFSNARPKENRITLKIEVSDSGIGMTEQQLKDIFKPFQQADVSITRKYGGSGLGLVISQRIARMMEGDILVESRPGIGSSFTVTIRLYKSARAVNMASNAPQISEQQSQSSSEWEALKGLDILVVDDDPINLTLAQALLEKVSVKVETANSGHAALSLVAIKTFDLILMDLEMPEISGFETADKIRKTPNGDRVPIIALTAHAFPEKRMEARQHGMNDLLAKPYRQERLYEIIRLWCFSPPSGQAEFDESDVLDFQALLLEMGEDRLKTKLAIKAFSDKLVGIREEITNLSDVSDIQGLSAILMDLLEEASACQATGITQIANQLIRVLRSPELLDSDTNDLVLKLLDEIVRFRQYALLHTA